MGHEKQVRVLNGWAMLAVTIAVFLFAVALLREFVYSAIDADQKHQCRTCICWWAACWWLASACFLCNGFFALQPNEGRVLILFGAYCGTVREAGWHWTNPLNTKKRISLRAKNLNGDKLKVNDKRGNPIEIAAVVVWRVQDTFQASFDVEKYEEYVRIQSESAVRHLANSYAYDHGEANEITLRSGVEEVCAALQKELQERVAKAGVQIDEARLTHLAYAPEIAGVMLRRQQAEAIIAARQMIVHGAVSMVQMALKDLTENKIIDLDEERKATMVSNLLVVLCGDRDAQPVINAGTLYA